MKELEFKLIDNAYETGEAEEVLLALIKSKINFLNHKIFSSHLKTGETPPHLEKRIAELSKDREILIEKFKAIKNGNCEIKINCEVKMKIEEVIPV